MFRQYRQGELPDVRIKGAELLQPLQALLQRDLTLAKMFFSAFTTNISKVFFFYVSVLNEFREINKFKN